MVLPENYTFRQALDEASAKLPPNSPFVKRTFVALVLDASGSMAGSKIQEVNEGLQILKRDLMNDKNAQGVDVMVIEVKDSATVISDFQDVQLWTPPKLSAGGLTALGEGVNVALDRLRQKKDAARATGISYYRPWIVIMSDGEPTDENWEQAADRCRQAEKDKGALVIRISVPGANREKLDRFSSGVLPTVAPVSVKEVFQWLSASIGSVGQTGGMVQFPVLSCRETD